MEMLTEDVVLEILLRVTGIRDLFRCAVTCKRWRLLVADYSFLRRRWPEGASRSSLLGFFSEISPLVERRVAGIIPTPMPPFTPAPWSPFVHRRRFLNIPKRRGYRTVPLTSRRGLLLVCFIPYDGPFFKRAIKMAVCDPITCKNHPLAPLKWKGLFRVEGCTVLTRADCYPNERRQPVSSKYKPTAATAFCKVLIISLDAQDRYSLHVFTSDDSSWSMPAKFFDPWEQGENIVSLQFDAAVCQGSAHWLYKGRSSHYMLNVNTDTAHISLTKLPIAPNQQPGFDFYSAPLLSVTNDGALSLLRLYRKCTGLEIWTRQGRGSVNGLDRWHLTKMIRLRRPERSRINMVQCMWAGEMSGALLIKDNQNCMYIVDIETRTIETVTEMFRGPGTVTTPFEMDWPVFFMSRLAGGTITRKKLKSAVTKVTSSFWRRLFGMSSLD